MSGGCVDGGQWEGGGAASERAGSEHVEWTGQLLAYARAWQVRDAVEMQ